MTLIGLVFLREAYTPFLLRKKSARLRSEGDPSLAQSARPSLLPLLARAISRPVRMLFADPITPTASIYMGVIYGVSYLLFTTFATVFQKTYGFKEGVAGLSYLGLGIGCTVGLVFFGHFSDRIYADLTKKGKAKPEYVVRDNMLHSYD
jgi:MFS family permease